jgi:hypothetical protein
VHVEVPDEPPADASFEELRSYHDLHGAASDDDAALALAAVSLQDLLARTEYEPTLGDETAADAVRLARLLVDGTDGDPPDVSRETAVALGAAVHELHPDCESAAAVETDDLAASVGDVLAVAVDGTAAADEPVDDETLAATTELPESAAVPELPEHAAGEGLPLGKALFAAWSTYAGRTDSPHVDAELLLRSAGFVATTGAYPAGLERRAEAVREALATPDPPAVDEAHLDAASPGGVVGDEADPERVDRLREGYDDLLDALGVGRETLDADGEREDGGESAGRGR